MTDLNGVQAPRERPRSRKKSLLAELIKARVAALDNEAAISGQLDLLDPAARISGANLAHYSAVRQFDLRRAQRQLASSGLSSLGRAEAHVLATLDATMSRIADDLGVPGDVPPNLGQCGPKPQSAHSISAERTTQALGRPLHGNIKPVMVTLPTKAASDPALVERYVNAGMTIARINCAHDNPEDWHAMVKNVHAAAATQRHSIRIAIDLPGPKLRVGSLPVGPQVRRVRPLRDVCGVVIAPATVHLVASVDTNGPATDARRGEAVYLPLDRSILEHARVGDEIQLADARGRRRRLLVEDVGEDGLDASVSRTCFFQSGLRVTLRRNRRKLMHGEIGQLPFTESVVVIRAGDSLDIRLGDKIGRLPVFGENGRLIDPGVVYLDVPEVFEAVSVGDRVLIDDGKISGRVRNHDAGSMRIDFERPGVSRLREGKGINLPDTNLSASALTSADLAALHEMIGEIDLVSMSYVRTPADIVKLQQELDLAGSTAGIILKLENREACDRLPALLLTALRRTPLAVMIARGDLAAEVGFDRLAELQEEILWFCGAAHVPVIWATQVLETLAKQGIPSRAEVTDAAWASRAECVMLNKGPYIPETIQFLNNVFERMETHLEKGTSMMRRLSIADGLQHDEGSLTTLVD